MKRLLVFLFAFVVGIAHADTININWKVGNSNYAQSTCQTGGGLTLPATTPTKYGYVFRGWEINSIVNGSIRTASKNLFDVNNAYRVSRDTGAKIPLVEMEGGAIANNGFVVTSPSALYYQNYMIEFDGEENTRYTISLKQSASVDAVGIYFVYSDGTSSGSRYSDTTLTNRNWTSAANKTVVGFGLDYGYGTQTLTYKDIQIEKGTSATSYEEYTGLREPSPTNPVEPIFYTAGNLVLRALRNGDDVIADTYDLSTGIVTRRIGVAVLDGTEDWVLSGTTFVSEIIDSNPVLSYQKLLYCSHFPALANSSETFGVNITFYSGLKGWLYVKGSGHDDVNSWKQWLADQRSAGTPVTVYYPLATPIQENRNQ